MNLNQVTVPVTDVEKSIHFYETLGLKLIVRALPHYARFTCPEGDSTFSLHQVDEIAVGSNIWVYFELDNLDERVRELINKGIIFDDLPEDKSWLWREARLKDPDGNQLILYFAGGNRKGSALESLTPIIRYLLKITMNSREKSQLLPGIHYLLKTGFSLFFKKN